MSRPPKLKDGEFLMSDGSIVTQLPKIQTRNYYHRPFAKASGPSLTSQSHKAESDINNIMKRYLKDGVFPAHLVRQGVYGDFSDAPTFQESLNIVAKAQEQFDSLPAKLRARFENDPAQFLEFVNDPKNAEELVKMGLATERKPTPIPEPQKVIIVNPDDPTGSPDPDSKKSKK